jgi:hypothetical protein
MDLGKKSTFPQGLSLNFDLNPSFESYPGNVEFYTSPLFPTQISMSAGYFALGGNKQSIRAPPVFWCKLADSQEKRILILLSTY